MKNRIIYILLAAILGLSSCESFLDRINPDDKIVADKYWNEAQDAVMALNGIYSVLKNTAVYGYGGGMDACTPNAFQWAHWEGRQMQIGNGSVFSGSGGIIGNRWKFCYTGINNANYFFENVDKIADLSQEEREIMKGEAYFLRGLYYDLLARSYGGVPIVLKTLTIAESRQVKRETIEDTWAQVHSDFDEAIKRLPKDAKINGRATLGSAYGMKMKVYLYNSEWDKVLEYCKLIEGLNKYKLYPSYYGLFQFENEGNDETLFSVGFMNGEFKQGSVFDRFWQPQNIKHNIDGSNSVSPTQTLVNLYETLDGSPIDPANPYANRDPRLELTILRPGALFQGQRYPDEIKNHTGQKVGFGIRKYTIETIQVVGNQSPLDFMILRYGDVLLCEAEALIESSTNRDIGKAIGIINRIRTEREDVKMPPISTSLSQVDARKALRHERRIELALEGQFWDDMKRWNIGPDLFPLDVIGSQGELVQRRFPNGYDLKKNNLIPLPDTELSMNRNLVQNPGY